MNKYITRTELNFMRMCELPGHRLGDVGGLSGLSVFRN